jgi:hypothetical protein
MPAGSEPAEIDQVYGVVPPVADNANPYPEPVLAPGREVVIIVRTELVEPVTVTDAVACLAVFATLVALTETEVVVVTVGAENSPELEIEPAVADQVTAVLLVPVT